MDENGDDVIRPWNIFLRGQIVSIDTQYENSIIFHYPIRTAFFRTQLLFE